MKKQITPEIARIHAHICGDGCVYIKKERRSLNSLVKHKRKNIYETVWVIEYTNTSKLLLDQFNDDLKIAFNRKGQIRTKYFRVKVSSVKWIVEFLQLKGKNSYNWTVPEFIINSSDELIFSWLRAFFDDEAHISKNGLIRVKSVNLQGLTQIRELLIKHEIYSSIHGPYSDKTYYLNIYKRFVPTYMSKIGFCHPDKKKISEWSKK